MFGPLKVTLLSEKYLSYITFSYTTTKSFHAQSQVGNMHIDDA